MTRSSLLRLLAPTFAFAFALGGCMANSSDVGDFNDVGLDILGSDENGHTGTNGLETDHFSTHEAALTTAMSTEIVSQGNLHSNVMQLVTQVGGGVVFSYAVKCALPVGTSVTNGVYTLEGHGILNSTTGWLNAGLNPSAQVDLMTCMIVHLNPSAMMVPIKLAGPAVINQAAAQQPDGNEYTFKEALWSAEYLTGKNEWRYHVWPLQDSVARCQQWITDAMKTRICGQGAIDCGLVVHTSLATCVNGATGYTSCDGKPVIQTWLKPENVDDLYPMCAPQPT